MIHPTTHNTLAFIPCRSGSKRLPNKNFEPLAGRSLVFRAIDFSLSMGFKTVVAPDREEDMVTIDQEYGNKITLFLRDPDLADGAHQLESWSAAHEAIEAHAQMEYPFGIMFEPSSPLRLEEDVLMTLSKLNHFPSVGTVTSQPRLRPQKLYLLSETGKIHGNLDGRINFPGGQWDIVNFNGVAYAADRDTILNQRLWNNMGTHVVPGMTFNIDTEQDFEAAEAYFRDVHLNSFQRRRK